MAKIPFDIKFKPQIESGEYKVETRDGKPARIICWDKKEYEDQREQPTPIVYLITSKGGCEHIMSCTTAGMYSDGLERDYDLFIVTPEPELSEFELKLSDVVGYAISLSVAEPQKPTSEFVKEYAAELLTIARKELVDDMQLQFDDEINEAYYRGRKDGKADASKDLPRWEKWGNGACGNSDGHPIALVAGCGGIRFVSCLGTTGEKYIFLSDLKKLPGFNED